MSVIVSDNIQEEFSKPPPKKKWLKDYSIEKDSVLMGTNMRKETQHLVKLLGKQSNEGMRLSLAAANKPHKFNLSQDVIGGVVQGVIDQFQDYFENDKKEESESGEAGDDENDETTPDEPEPRLSQNEITPVVQSVISQFLNGSLSDSGFRRSRKRSHKHINSRSKDRASNSSAVSSRLGRHSSVIQFNTAQCVKSPIKVRRIETLLDQPSSPAPSTDASGALNLSKTGSKVTFASLDNCYTSDSIRTHQTSKSMIMFSADYNRKLHESLKLINQQTEEDNETPLDLASDKSSSQPLDLARKSELGTPVIRFGNLGAAGQRQSPPLVQVRPVPGYSSLPVTRHSSPIIETDSSSQFQLSNFHTRAPFHNTDDAVPLAVVKPKPIKPLFEAGSKQMLHDLYASKQGHSIFSSSTTGESFKEKSKPASLAAASSGSRTNTREVHNRLEKNRRAHLKSCFNELAAECDLDPNKASNLLVIRTAYKCIMGLRREEREQERNLAALVQEKIRRQSRLNELKREVSGYCDEDSDSD